MNKIPTVYGVIQSDGTHCDVSHSEKGAKNYATRHGYKYVTARANGGYHAPVIAIRRNNKWERP